MVTLWKSLSDLVVPSVSDLTFQSEVLGPLMGMEKLWDSEMSVLKRVNVWKAAIEVRKECFLDVRPVDTIMAVSGFVNPEWLIEIEADAVIADKPDKFHSL